MKTEDIDKRIGMPDVNEEWARFEQEVISGGTKRRSAIAWAFGIGIAASVALLLIYNIGKGQMEQVPLTAQTGEIMPQPVKEDVQVREQELVAKAPKPVIAQNKKMALAKANASAASSLDIPAREYTGAVQKMEDLEDIAFESVDQALQDIASADLGSDTTMRLRGTSSKEPVLQGVIAGRENIDPTYNDSILVLLDGKRLPDSLCTRQFARRGIHKYLEKKGLLVDKIVRLNEESVRIKGDEQAKQRYKQYVEQYGRLAQLGVAEITSANDSANEVFVLQHPELKKTFRRVEGFVMEESTNEPLESTIIRYRQFATSADPIGHFVLWIPKSVDTLYAKCIGCQDAFFQPADTTLTIRLKDNQRSYDIASADLGSGKTLRLRGTGDYRPSDKDRMDSTLILVNGEPLPEHLKQEVLGNNPDDIDSYMPRYFSRQGLLIDSVYVHKDSYYTEKYGGRAKYGLIEIKTVPDTYCDAYVRKHPKLMKKYQRVEGYVVDNNGKPLTEAYVHVKWDFIGAPTDSTGHYVFWIPKKDVTLCAEQTGYRTVEFSPSDKTLVMHLEPGASMRLRGNPEPTSELQGVIAGLPDAPPNDSILYIVNGVPQPKENNKWLGKMSYLDYFKRQHLLVDSVKRNMNEEAKQRYLEKYGEAAKHGVVEYFCVEDTLCDYYMNQHEELKASRRRVSGVVYDDNDEPLDHTMINIWHEKRVWGFETTDSLGNFTFWVPRTDVKLEFTYVGFYKAVVVEPSDTFQTIYLLPNDNLKSLRKSLKF